jgi:23S rRNA pseudouridine1911/1915/1917 synthase
MAPPVSELVPEASVPFRIAYEDDHLIVVDKPAGVVTHPSAGHREGTLVHGLLAHAVAGGADPTRPGIVHRLDRDTSGLLVVARSERAHRRLQRLMRDREIRREYVALVHGAFPPALTVDRPIGRDRRVRTRQSINAEEGREAVTHLRRLEDLGRFSLVEARLDTGRTHQIRVHLESVGHPVVGDRVYGRREETLGLERQFLHAAHLAFPHPETGEEIDVRSPLPHDLELALGRARRMAQQTP